jgi:hypothetical protein
MKINIILLILILFTIFSASAKTLIVSKTLAGSSYKTINEAAAVAVAGDTILVMPGLYNEKVIIKNKGNTNKHLVLKSQSDTLAIIDGTGISLAEWGNGLIHVNNLAYIDIFGFKVINSKANGIYAGSSNHIRISNCKTYNTKSSGIGMWFSSHVKFDSNDVVMACNDGGQECISVAGCDSFEICYNHVHHGGPGTNGGEGIDSKHGTYGWVHDNHVHDLKRLGIYVDAWNVHMHHVWVYNNRVHNCNAWGIAVANEDGGLLSDVFVYNNISYSNAMMGIGAEGNTWGTAGKTHQLRNIHIYNNTCYNNGGSWGGGIHVNGSNCDSIFVRNNILALNKYSQLVIENGPTNLIMENNLIYGTNTNGRVSKNQINGNPLFTDAAKNDFHIQKNSPAIGKVTLNDCPTFDYDYETRIDSSGSVPDVGAFEYQISTGISENIKNTDIIVYPNPANEFITIQTNHEGFVEVYNDCGESKLAKSFNTDHQRIYLNNLRDGIYILKITTKSGEIKISKLIKISS